MALVVAVFSASALAAGVSPPAGEKPATQPSFRFPQARAAAAQYERTLNEAQEAYRRAAAANKKYIADLDRALTAATKAGNLDEALAIRTEKARIEQAADSLPTTPAAARTSVPPKAGGAAARKRVGRFLIYNQYGTARLFINGREVFKMGKQSAEWSPIVQIGEGVCS